MTPYLGSSGPLKIGGEMRHFAITGKGLIKTKQGFGLFLSADSANGGSVGWPAWLPIKIKNIGIEWPNINQNPLDFVLTLSASYLVNDFYIPFIAGGRRNDKREVVAARASVLLVAVIGCLISWYLISVGTGWMLIMVSIGGKQLTRGA